MGAPYRGLALSAASPGQESSPWHSEPAPVWASVTGQISLLKQRSSWEAYLSLTPKLHPSLELTSDDDDDDNNNNNNNNTSSGEGNGNPLQILAWKIPWTEEPGGLYSPWGLRELNTTEKLNTQFSPQFSEISSIVHSLVIF